jgi:cytochrome c oxidase assembly protein subunit 15
MAFREWLTPDGSLMPLYPWFSSAGDKFIEHGHRLLAMAVGLLTIGLVIATVRREPRPWVRAYSVGLLFGVVGQGVLGGGRVVLNERVLALVHGCVGPLFFAACAGMVVVTSPRWRAASPDPESIPAPRDRTLLRMAVVTAALAYLQLVLGALVRHSPYMVGEDAGVIFQFAVYAHVATALIVVVQTLRLAIASWRRPAPRGLAIVLAGLALFQILLGFSSWIVKYGMPLWLTQLVGETGHFNRASDMVSAAIVTAHGATGALIVALAVVAALVVGRFVGVPWRGGSAFAGKEAMA